MTTMGGISFLVSLSLVITTIWLSVSNKPPLWVMLAAVVMLFPCSGLGFDLINSEKTIYQYYGHAYMIFISVLAGGLVSSSISELRQRKQKQ